MTKHEYRAKYRGFVVMLDKEQATYWWQGGGGYQSLTKACKAIDDKAKKEIGLDLDGKPGTVLGGMFKAILNQFPVTRLNQAKLETERPRIWASYRETNDEQRITYEVR